MKSPAKAHHPVQTSIWPVVIFTLLYLGIAAVFALGNGNWEFVFYIGVVVLLSVAALYVHHRVGLTRSVLWSLSAWGLLHMVGGLVHVPEGWAYNGTKPVFYSLWIIPDVLKYDHLVHAFGFGIATWICWLCVKDAMKHPRPSFGTMVLCALGGMGLGAFNEVVEFVAVLLIPDTNVGGYVNTGWDLVANLIGATVAACLIGIFGKQRAR